jgi:hypothetical protein
MGDGGKLAGMKYTSLEIENFRGLGKIVVPLHRLTCIIGENNAGKSSVLHALHAVMPGSGYKITQLDFGDSSSPIRIALRIEGIGKQDLERIAPNHRQSVANDVVDGALTLVRTGELRPDKVASRLGVVRRRPIEERWRSDVVAERLKGNAGSALREVVRENWPELADTLKTQTAVIAAITAHVAAFPVDELQFHDAAIGTGIEQGYAGLLPEVIYVASVKDVADEVKTTDSAVFGKLVGLLLESVKEELGPLDDQFQGVRSKLSRVVGDDGTSLVDDRLPAVKDLEARLAGFTQEAFPGVQLEIDVPVPQLKTILNSATVLVDDGHMGLIGSKGDGLKRAFIFALLRTLMEHRASNNPTGTTEGPGCWLLFEEPELYLYPHAQRLMFRALEAFSSTNQVIVTTHSPAFLEAESRDRAFVKLSKKFDGDGKPCGAGVHQVSLAEEADRDAFQLIQHENNTAGFFAKEVVLVEGDSDAVVFQHLARLLGGDAWNAVERNVTFARIDGKGNIGRYRRFFAKFGVDVHVIVDLDVLARGFDKLEVTPEIKTAHSQLQQDAIKQLSTLETATLGNQSAKELAESRDFKSRWDTVMECRKAWEDDADGWEEFRRSVDEFFALPRRRDLVAIYRDPDPDLAAQKAALLKQLAEQRVYVLSRGTVENYYGGSKRAKVEDAVRFKDECLTIDEFRGRAGAEHEPIEVELRDIFSAILGPA